MTRNKVTATVLSLMLLVGLSALADAPDAEQDHRNPKQEIVLEGAAPEAPVEAVISAEHRESDSVVPIYVPAPRGSTLVQDGSGVTGARRPGVRL